MQDGVQLLVFDFGVTAGDCEDGRYRGASEALEKNLAADVAGATGDEDLHLGCDRVFEGVGGVTGSEVVGVLRRTRFLQGWKYFILPRSVAVTSYILICCASRSSTTVSLLCSAVECLDSQGTGGWSNHYPECL